MIFGTGSGERYFGSNLAVHSVSEDSYISVSRIGEVVQGHGQGAVLYAWSVIFNIDTNEHFTARDLFTPVGYDPGPGLMLAEQCRRISDWRSNSGLTIQVVEWAQIYVDELQAIITSIET